MLPGGGANGATSQPGIVASTLPLHPSTYFIFKRRKEGATYRTKGIFNNKFPRAGSGHHERRRLPATNDDLDPNFPRVASSRVNADNRERSLVRARVPAAPPPPLDAIQLRSEQAIMR